MKRLTVSEFRDSLSPADLNGQRIIIIALISTLLMMAIVFFMFYNINSAVQSPVLPFALLKNLSIIILLLTPVSYLFAQNFSRNYLKNQLTSSDKLEDVQGDSYFLFFSAIKTTMIVNFALMDMLAITSLVLFYLATLSGYVKTNPILFINFAPTILTILAVIIKWPTEDRLVKLYEETLK